MSRRGDRKLGAVRSTYSTIGRAKAFRRMHRGPVIAPVYYQESSAALSWTPTHQCGSPRVYIYICIYIYIYKSAFKVFILYSGGVGIRSTTLLAPSAFLSSAAGCKDLPSALTPSALQNCPDNDRYSPQGVV